MANLNKKNVNNKQNHLTVFYKNRYPEEKSNFHTSRSVALHQLVQIDQIDVQVILIDGLQVIHARVGGGRCHRTRVTAQT